MELLLLNQEDVEALLPMPECIEVIEEALRALARGEATLPLRSIHWGPERRGALGLMPSFTASPSLLGVKVISYFPGNLGSELDSHQGVVLLFEGDRGRPLALLDATSITSIRTAAASGVATRALARPDAGDLAILGSGTEARTHLQAMAAARKLRRVRVWSRSLDNARAFAERESRRAGIAIEPIATAREAVAGADLICTTTSATEPVLCGEWLSPGAHVNAVGACFPAAREIDGPAVARSRLFVDRRESALNEAGDFLIARREGFVTDAHILGEVGDLLLGRIPGRTSADDITLFKSLGISVEDLAAGHHVYRKALAQGAGTRIAWGGLRQGAV